MQDVLPGCIGRYFGEITFFERLFERLPRGPGAVLFVRGFLRRQNTTRNEDGNQSGEKPTAKARRREGRREETKYEILCSPSRLLFAPSRLRGCILILTH